MNESEINKLLTVEQQKALLIMDSHLVTDFKIPFCFPGQTKILILKRDYKENTILAKISVKLFLLAI
jgi:hypothetical protein